MGNAAKELRVDITGNADKFGEAVKKAESYINELKKQGLDALTAGVYTGGAAALASKTIDAIRTIVGEIKTILDRADRLNVSVGGAVNLKRFGDVLGVDVGAIDAGVQQARQARADALAGDDQAAKAFERIGVSLEEIVGLKPDELFQRILSAAKDRALDAESFFAFSRILSQGSAEAILPYAKNPEALSMASDLIQYRQIAGGIAGGLGLSGTADPLELASLVGAEPLKLFRPALRELRQPFEPFSSFGIAQREQTEAMTEQNRQRMLLVGRSQLSTEQRINEVIAERLRLTRLIEDEKNPLKRQKLIANAINVEGELAGLTIKRQSELQRSPGKLTTDPLRAIGADFSRFSPTLATSLAQRQVDEIARLRATTEAGLDRVARLLSNDL